MKTAWKVVTYAIGTWLICSQAYVYIHGSIKAGHLLNMDEFNVAYDQFYDPDYKPRK